MTTIHRFTFLKRREGLTPARFLEEWRMRGTGSEGGIVRNEVQPAVEGLMPEPIWDGLLALPMDGMKEPVERGYSDLTEPTSGIADPDQVVEFVAQAKVVLDGPARGIKILSLPRRRSGMSPADFSRHYREVHGTLVSRNDAFVKYANRYVQHHVLAQTVRATGGFVPYDGISEFWFDSLDHARSAWDAPSYMAELRADEKNFVGSPPSHRILVVPVGEAAGKAQ